MSGQSLNLARKRDAAKLTEGMHGVVVYLLAISCVINLLALTGSLYMMQVYDRALTSGSVQTLIALSVIALGLYIFQGGFDAIRTRMLVRVGARFDHTVAPIAHRVTMDMPRFGFSGTEALERGRDVDTVRSFLSGQGPGALFDLPWIPIYLAFIYLLHPWLGALTLAGAVVLTLMTLGAEVAARRSATEARQAAMTRNAIADSNARNAEVIKAMGMAERAARRFAAANEAHLALQTRASDVSGSFGTVSKVLRMVLQSAVLGLGAFLTIKGELSAGAIIAASVASSRALAPVDQAIANWKPFVAARQSFARLRETIVALSKAGEPMPLPAPNRHLKVDRITVSAPGSGQILLSDVSFEVMAGSAVGIIGPSGGGKTTLVRALTGIWPTLRGSVRLDGAELEQWLEEDLGRAIGYLPQEVGLLDATVEENISRLAENEDSKAVIAAATAADIHDMVVRLPGGYRTPLGPQGTSMSAGQRQRIGLARALYGSPFLVIMDEPNSNLDGEGEAALTRAIEQLKARGAIVVIVAHRPSALAAVDYVGVIQAGKLAAFGPKEQIIRPGTASPHEQAKASPGLPSVNAFPIPGTMDKRVSA
ncbi:type I secretion system permease/ATPase [Bosea sp. BH3]|uniref:type I secretion system permease/ATPase n=1 Tax=Bosea sp. BH3 TaxID=2871701 RepID=UPI0021CB58C3|nr:type I secretion system permease/ATPase [Bosea sp. BH3]MCU4179764.1 type I secretion system permease/ATPase [Bosea sp. BH3]